MIQLKLHSIIYLILIKGNNIILLNYIKKRFSAQIVDSEPNDKDDNDKCTICMVNNNTIIITNCGHKLCDNCALNIRKKSQKNYGEIPVCPYCRAQMIEFTREGNEFKDLLPYSK
ncbi:uncharacterized protein LOC126909291 isoform X1 [Daktulosphaira vitifoliae]|uniref:uncharacterized protein LOC126909291 isoform X1 n=1 Tax=Daktulosphaira vitifoliae TaxID=58002 RepID=UPI0021AA3127|nr:uncharacterized protein LOC126909291 isoform X1 [Daktulosphaira vitifoliae]